MRTLVYIIAEHNSLVPGYNDDYRRHSYLGTYDTAKEARDRLLGEMRGSQSRLNQGYQKVITLTPFMLTLRVKVPLSFTDKGRWKKTAWQTVCYRIEPTFIDSVPA